MSNGNLNPLNDLSRVYLDHVAKINQNTEEIEKKRWEGELNLQMKTDAVEGYQRDPEGQEKDRKTSKQTDPSKDGFTGIGDSIADIMKQNAEMKKAAAKKKVSEEKKGKRWQDDDGDGKWYEKSDVDGKISKREKEEKKKAVKEHHQKDADGNTIPHQNELLKLVADIVNPISEDELKEDKCDCDCGKVPCVTCGGDHHEVEEGYGKKKAKKVKKESFSDWRTDLREIMTDDEEQKEIKEKNVKNKIKINPKLGEAIEEIGGEVLEAYTLTRADRDGNTKAWQDRKKKNVKTGEPLYKKADHMKEEEDLKKKL